MSANQSQLVLDTACMKITREPVGLNASELFPKAQISGVKPLKFQTKPSFPNDQYWTYRFNTVTQIVIYISDGRKVVLELQEITNQPTWNAGTLVALNQAITDINAWLITASFDADLLALLAQPSYPSISTQTKNGMNFGFQSFKAGSNNFAKHDRIFFNCLEDVNQSFYSWANPTSTKATLIGSPTWTKYRGFFGGTGKAINSHYVPSTDGVNFTQNSSCIWVLFGTFHNAVQVIIGNTNIQLFPDFNGDIYAQVNGGLVNITLASAANNVISVNRPNATTTEIWINGVLVHTGTAASSAPTSEEIYMLAANLSGTPTYNYAGELNGAGWGAGNMNQLELYNSIIDVWGAMPVHQVLGDSIGAGFAATIPETQGMYSVYTDAIGYGLHNLSLSGATADTYLASLVPTRPKRYDNGQRTFIEYGVNDALLGGLGTTNYFNQLGVIKTKLVTNGYTSSSTVMVTGNHVIDNGAGFLVTYLTYRQKAKDWVVANTGVVELDLYPQTSITLVDPYHPDDPGHLFGGNYVTSTIGI